MPGNAPHRKSRIRNAALVLVVLSLTSLVGIGIFEMAMRLTDYRFLLRKTEFPQGYFQADSALGADQAPNVAPARFTIRAPAFETFTNWLGCFDRDSEIQPGYILAVGDSATWGFVPSEANWTHRLQVMTGKQVLNCGVTGIGPKYATLKARKVIEQIGFPPSLVILLYIDNDLNDDFVFPSYTVVSGQRLDRVNVIDLESGRLDRLSDEELHAQLKNYRSERTSLKTWLKHNSLTAWMLFQLRERLFPENDETTSELLTDRYSMDLWNVDIDNRPWLRVAIQDHLNAIMGLQNLADNYSIPLVVFEDRTEGLKPSPHREEFSERLRAQLRWVHAIELSDETRITPEQIHHRFDDHWNVDGNQLAAEMMFEYLKVTRLLPDDDAIRQ